MTAPQSDSSLIDHSKSIDVSDRAQECRPQPERLTEEEVWAALTIPEGDPVPEMSPAFDESVIGFPEDIQPKKKGVAEILEVVSLLGEAKIPCCVVAEAALIYYGAARTMREWVLCVPTDQVDTAADKVRVQSDRYMPFRRSAMYRLGGLEFTFPRFKYVGVALFFIIISAQDYHIPCEPTNFELGQTGIPFPKLNIYAQSLLDSGNLVDLDDLIDGMNLTREWGEGNLDLEGTVDVEWIERKIETLHKNGERIFMWDNAPKKRRDLWEKHSSVERKKRGQGWKFQDSKETRFWNRGQKDPRKRVGGF